jgi:hypothetical protein
LFTWRNNDDEQFIQPVIQQWITLPAYLSFWQQFNNTRPPQPYLSWSAATISSLNRKLNNIVYKKQSEFMISIYC